MDHFPIFLDLRRRHIVVVGGGAPAARKIELLLAAGAAPLVVAPELNSEIAGWAAAGRCTHDSSRFHPGCLDGALLVFVATDDEALTLRTAAAAQARGVPVNVVDRPELCSFIMPAILDRAPVVIAISTGGASPTVAQMIRARIDAAVPASFGRLARLAGALRPLVQGFIPTAPARMAFWRAALGGRVAELVHEGRDGTAYLALLSGLNRAARQSRTPRPTTLDA
jgi:uroporphyrin-III C-methyltransferase/precorrin-2 dehydrogenase/sirohydrochlorin ferrochelatase